MQLETEFLVWAVFLGALSAASLPLGSAVGLAVRPSTSFMAALTAFGAGALIAALALELVAPTALAIGHSGAGRTLDFLALVTGSVAGGVLFVVSDAAVNARGGFLRKTATTVAYFSVRMKRRTEALVGQLATVGLLRELSADHLQWFVNVARPTVFQEGEVIFDQGSPGDRVYFIADGAVQLYRGGAKFKLLEAGDVVGEIALLTGAPRTAQAVAARGSHLVMVLKEDFDRLRRLAPELDEHVRSLASYRLQELRADQITKARLAAHWVRDAARALKHGTVVPSPLEVKQVQAEHGGAPLAIWLGILLDGIPESLAIGLGFLALLTQEVAGSGNAIQFAEVVPYTLIAGLFLSNFPEAMSSSVGMRSQGWDSRRILTMWASITAITALGAGVGYGLGEALPHGLLIGIEGLAAGAMLTMIASAMLPEAVHLGGGPIAGLSTLIGFLSAVSFNLFE